MKREPGFYWVNVPAEGGWQPAETAGEGDWYLCSADVPFREDSDWEGQLITEVGERIERDILAEVKAVVDELCAHEGAEGFSAGTHDRVDALYRRLGIA